MNIYNGVLKINNNDVYRIWFNEYPTISDDGEYDLFVFESDDKNLIKSKFSNIDQSIIYIDNADLLVLYDLNIISNSISFKDCELITKSTLI